MPKMKTHSGASKRMRLTGGGRIRRTRANHQHNFRTKSNRQIRQLRKSTLVDPADERRMRRLLARG
jgi:large subunit ribosomal protein L35